ncbi:hypothetical protein FPZ43_18085 [Mucilaginibacter pallidiroseus]|uniref:Uncharacterized protein n=1 Tax=Mucilaginibacter pallidiroseus TaxID=2599295 RepID=A0A563TZK9_9SPHI|nr:hypothetical protein [Mucilaginibacter pallidiroseus]TWR24806.1 hypothetical protein FPZ43_18085 [Mucilaginibacter pallidiroseus]
MLPEGGHLVYGLPCRVAFKAVDSNGAPANVSGVLMNKGRVMKAFKSYHAGMGVFDFTPSKGENYDVKVLGYNDSALFLLPKIEDKGMTLHLMKYENDTLFFRISPNSNLTKRKVYLRLQVRWRVQSIDHLGSNLFLKSTDNQLFVQTISFKVVT